MVGCEPVQSTLIIMLLLMLRIVPNTLCDYPSFSSAAAAVASSVLGLSRRHGDYADECVCSDINQLLFTQAGRSHIYLSDIHSVEGICPICFVSDACERARGALVHAVQLIRDSDSQAAR